MATFLFVFFFVLLGLGTVLVAMRSGSRGPLFDPQKRSGRRTVAWLTGLIVLAFGIAVPVAVGIEGKDSKDDAEGIALTASEQRGRELFSPTCAQCHTLSASNAVGRVGPNLDNLRPPAKLVVDAIEKGRYQGRGQMPDRLFEGQDAEDVANYVGKVAGR